MRGRGDIYVSAHPITAIATPVTTLTLYGVGNSHQCMFSSVYWSSCQYNIPKAILALVEVYWMSMTAR